MISDILTSKSRVLAEQMTVMPVRDLPGIPVRHGQMPEMAIYLYFES